MTFMQSQKYKIKWTDGFARESVADYLVCENIPSKELGEIMLKALLSSSSESDHYSLIPQDSRLWRGMEEFI